jgi:hypothetical protein
MTAARHCSTTVNKYRANKDLEHLEKNSHGSFYNLIRSKLNYKFDCGAVPHGNATADSADAAQVDRLNIAESFRRTQKSSRQIYAMVRYIVTKL